MKPFSYSANNSKSRYALTEWTFESYLNCETYVVPDGCRDFILLKNTKQCGDWFISDLSEIPYCVSTAAGSHISGIRLQPGVELCLDNLSDWLHGKDPALLFGSDQIDEFCTRAPNLAEALDCLASGKRTVHCAAKELGVSLRSLQRLVKTGTDQTPYFWFSLARIRKAGRSLIEDRKLSDIAIEYGFSDQAHMNREMKGWFGKTPNQIKSDPEFLSIISESGYG